MANVFRRLTMLVFPGKNPLWIWASDARICGFGDKIGGTGVKIGCSWAKSGGFRAKIVASTFRIGPLETKLGVPGPRFGPLEPRLVDHGLRLGALGQ